MENKNIKEKGFPTPLPKRKITSFTGDQIKDKIVNFLEGSKSKKFPIRESARQLIDIASYPTILKWSEVLIGEGKIQSEHYGNIKLVFIENGKTK